MAALPSGRAWSRSLGLVVGFLVGSLAALASGGPLLRNHLPDPMPEWGWFLLWSVVAPGLGSVSLERRWPQFARGLGIAVVIVGCPLNVLILMGLLAMGWAS